MFDSSDARWGEDPRDSYDADPRDRDADDGRSPLGDADPRERGDRYERELERDHGWDARDRDPDDPRDVLLEDLHLPRGLEREVVWDHDQTYELNGEDSRTLAAVDAFRVVPEGDLREDALDPRSDSLDHLRDEGLLETMPLDERDRGVVLTDRGRELLEMHRRDRDDERGDRYGDRVNRRELTHDASVYDAYRHAASELRQRGADVRDVVMERELKREYQEFLQERNRERAGSDGRPDRDAREVEQWAREHELPYFDERVHFPDVRLEYELEGRHHHLDIEVVTEHYRGAHAASRGRCGFACYASRGSRGGGGRLGGFAEELV
jgi:hypothetical protein